MIRPPTLHLTLAAAVALLAACADGRDTASGAEDHAPIAGRDCSRAQGDSARAACTALNQIERISGVRAVVVEYQRRGDTICVETIPRDVIGVDGGGAVEVVRGRVATAVMVDSGGCRKW